MPKSKTPTPQELYRARKQREEQERLAYLPPGLYNHGNTCFMNSVLQGLIATRLLSDLAQFQPIPKHIQRHPNSLASRKSPLLTNAHELGAEFERPWVNAMPIGDVLLDLLLTAWSSQMRRRREIGSPKPLLGVLGRKHDQYLDFAQQDAHEFLRILLDATRMEELDVIKQRQPPRQDLRRRRRTTITPSLHRSDAESSEIQEEDKLISLADMVFGGKLTSILVCQKCKHVSQTSEDFNDLSLSLKAEDYRLRKRERFMNFAKRLTVFPAAAFSLGTDVPRSSSVPPRPTGQDVQQLDGQNGHVSDPRRKSLDIIPDQQGRVLQEDSSTAGNAFPQAIPTGVFMDAGKHTEVPSLVPKGEKKQKEKKERDNWAKLGRRISLTVGLSKALKEAKDRGDTTSPDTSRPSFQSGVSWIQTNEDAALTGKNGSAPTAVETNISEAASCSTPAIILSRPPSPPNFEESFISRASSPFFPPRPSSRDYSQPVRSKSPKPPKPSRGEMEYLRAILADTTSPSNIHFHLFRPNAQQNENLWLSMDHFSGIEECLRIFTSVEVLDGENMVGCRRCWKIANGAYSAQSIPDEDEDSDSADSNLGDAPEAIQKAGTVFGGPVLAPLPLAPPSTHIPTSLSSPTIALYSHPNNGDRRSVSSLPEAPTEVDSVPDQSSKTLTPFESSTLPDTIPSLPRYPSETSAHSSDYAPIPIDHSMASLPSGSQMHAMERTVSLGRLDLHLSPRLTTDALTVPNARRHQSSMEETDESSAESEASMASSVSQGTDHNTPSQGPRKSSRSKPKPVIMRPAYKRYLIGTPPPVLVIHLKRFQQLSKAPLMSFSYGFKKLDDYVTFPEFLDLAPYLAPKKKDFGLGDNNTSSAEKRSKKREKAKCMYRLYAVVVHIGNMLGGHYIAYTALPDSQPLERHPSTLSDEKRGPSKQPRQWAYISDTVVRLTTLEEVLKAKAYICMYERI